MNSSAKLILWLSATFAALPAGAQAPIQFTDSAAAIRQYEERTLENLRDNCKTQKGEWLFDRAEITSMRHGFVSARAYVKDQNRYSVFIYDGDKHNFLMIDGQKLSRGSRLTIPLALPRDYAYCRIVRDSQGSERLEVLHRVLGAPAEAQAFDRLLKDAGELATLTPPANCPAPAKLSFSDRLVLKGTEVKFSGCMDAATSLRERMDKLVRRVHD